MNGIKPVDTPEGRKYELHWEGEVTTFDDQGEANRALVEKMTGDAGRPVGGVQGDGSPPRASP